jgi:MFS family permease
MSLKLSISLLNQRRFVPLWASQTLGAFNDNLLRWSLVFMASYQGVSFFGLPREEVTSIAGAMFTAGIFLFSAVAGQLADRFDRMQIMRTTKFAEIAIMVMAALGLIIGNAYIAFAALLLMGAQSAFFNPARQAAMPNMLQDHELVAGNGVISGLINVAALMGAVGAAAFLDNRNGSLIIAAILIGLAVVGWVSVLTGLPAQPKSKLTKIDYNAVTASWNIFKFLLRYPNVLRPMLGAASFWMVASAFLIVVAIFVRDILGGDPSVVLVIQVIFTVSVAIGALTAGAVVTNGEGHYVVILGGVGMAAASLFIALSTMPMSHDPSLPLKGMTTMFADSVYWPVFGAMAASAFFGGLYLVPQQAMSQRRADPKLRGRLLAGGGMINGFFATLGTFTLFVVSRLGLPVQSSFIFLSAGLILVVVIVLFRRLGKTNRTPS